MGYDLFITRRDNWSDDFGSEITFRDWLGYLSIDPSFQRDFMFGRDGARNEDSPVAIWTEWPLRSDGKDMRFRLENGNIAVTDPDVATRRKMFVMADVLGARVQGAKGELYDSVGNPESRKSRKAREMEAGSRSWWRFW